MLTTPRVFDDDHLPRTYPHRDAELRECFRCFDPVLEGKEAESLLLSGSSGVGKTSLARYALTELQSQAPVNTAHIRCLGKTPVGILRAMLEEVTRTSIPENVPSTELKTRLEQVDGPTIVILDEADDIAESDIVSTLLKINGISVISIVHNPVNWLSHLTPTTATRLRGDNHLSLDRYTVDELADILEDRANRGLPPGVVARRQLEQIADEVAGVARRGIQALRAAATIAKEREHQTIQESDIADSFARARQRIRRMNLRSLPLHHQILYAIIQSHGTITAEQLHQQYETIATDAYQDTPLTPIGKRSRRNKLQKLEAYDLIECEGAGYGRQYSAMDTAVSPQISLPSLLPT
ncbi:AAA family ATPase [Salinarchaeum sp. IM2453]|uniref:Cdc6/Cdc18 family protein n=1 Tax=Salinarchaeum sp. IM2453 TaxID=2862870 RepID=UPI001C834962|nr:AAA family ATPase [Salinarchaeum sp. IM2453]QZA89529.1 AAA family ATPase [Salinarchaeum sp. IM2453]